MDHLNEYTSFTNLIIKVTMPWAVWAYSGLTPA